MPILSEAERGATNVTLRNGAAELDEKIAFTRSRPTSFERNRR
jgi:hypothetical protein